MTAELYSELADTLHHWPHREPPTQHAQVGCEERLRLALRSLWRDRYSQFSECVGVGDLAGLIGHLLHRLRVLGESNIRLRVPCGPLWPDASRWSDAGITAVSETNSFLLSAGSAWQPEWLKAAPCEDSFREVIRRQQSHIPTDPAIETELGFTQYTAPGQQQALRSVFCSRPGATLMINLPTGTGKSLTAWAPAVLDGERKMTVVVIPTVALALDQERQMQRLLRRAGWETVDLLAWHGDLQDEERRLIRRRIREHRQPILFASPESVVGGLARALYGAAQEGNLGYFVLDEAHMVSQWGDDFRPEFQSLAGLRRDLLSQCPPGEAFRTLLLSATLTQETYEALELLFPPLHGEAEMVAAVHLRPEPSFWISHAVHKDEQEQRVLDAVERVPRPLLIYSTRREDAKKWAELLRSRQLVRVGCVTGETPARERSRVIRAWAEGKLDVISATSAFGLGMDKADVRTVIHACVPETVDRFYQEVGRGGRDGKACTSIVIYTNDDVKDAENLNLKSLITVDLGVERWKTMYHSRRSPINAGRDLIRVDLTTQRPGVAEDNRANQAWNLKTLILMARAGMIRLESEPPPESEQQSEEPDEVFALRREKEIEGYYTSVAVRIEAQNHLDKGGWQRAEQARQAIYRADKVNLDLMKDVLKGQREIAEIFRKLYAIKTPQSDVEVAPVCSGCAVCRRENKDLTGYHPPEALPIRKPISQLSGELKTICQEHDPAPLFVYYSPTAATGPRFRRLVIQAFLTPLIRMGVMEVAASDRWWADPEFRQLYRPAPNGYLIRSSLEEMDYFLPKVPRVTLIDPAQPPVGLPPHLEMMQERPLHVLMVPENLPHPYRPHQPRRALEPGWSFPEFLERLSR